MSKNEETIRELTRISEKSRQLASDIKKIMNILEAKKLDPQQKILVRTEFYNMLSTLGVDIENAKEMAASFEKLLGEQ